ncbi:MAG: 4-alpha-glucanotransferase [Spirochaetaceae bacterium]|jgi:4-alpha-glucanotransferase|nr:4-alpha-glucanotransferase [Spirochaetaceae bacterium]
MKTQKTADALVEKREAGILLAVSSLPAPYGIGTFGKCAYEWVDFLKKAGQCYWQILPLGPTSWGDSPYQSFSAFALNPYYIDLDILVKDGLLTAKELKKWSWGGDSAKVDYAALYQNRRECLRAAFRGLKMDTAYMRFCGKTSDWLTDYALFMTIKDTQGGKSFLQWPEKLKKHDNETLNKIKKEYKDSVQYYFFEQYIAHKQWDELARYARKNNISIIGDMPIYVALDSADVWAHSGFFDLKADMQPAAVAGCPPDPFAKNGQLWGNPLYNWDAIRRDGFVWWRRRLNESFTLYDVLRIDHFRGFESYYTVNAGVKSAKDGVWKPGPGIDFVNMIREHFPGKKIIAEDLGYQTPELKKFLAKSGFPGTKVLQFAFDSREKANALYMPYNYEQNSVVYTGTHDNCTSAAWPENANEKDRLYAEKFLNVQKGNWAQAFVNAALMSPSRTAIIPFQDYLGLGNEARMNVPATIGGGNWRYRVKKTDINDKLAKEIAHLTEFSGRL